MRHARPTANPANRVHALPPNRYRVPAASRQALCGARPIGSEHQNGYWRGTNDPITCKVCLRALEQLADHALALDPSALDVSPSRRLTVALPKD